MPSDVSDLLICTASTRRAPLASDLFTRSDPARSTSESLPIVRTSLIRLIPEFLIYFLGHSIGGGAFLSTMMRRVSTLASGFYTWLFTSHTKSRAKTSNN